ncbi:hypothetical protein [Arthrobacter caoxuetaonis]|uniref:Uncharacterized protein n=1 Tax=Arthrobacter caoxuetaonis TaxID=2886935 RepID=A0A9X1MHD9_9MICC|nr:hypothetical protein [Arthrobacter caoxuetaonis]MCC3299285.1 hypothetical protein [Arthrobacter caoxuetaonis]USQ59221.1 hypothetical protein NF551_16695 [Arthrobacter caoxuetaonis]
MAGRDEIREMSRWYADKMAHAGSLAMKVADRLAVGDTRGAEEALPAYLEARMLAEGVASEILRLSGYRSGPAGTR